jgi:hypothetical protein
MTRDQVLAQLAAIRAIVDAIAWSLREEAHPPATSSGGCDHPEVMRKDASTLRGPRAFYCMACKEIVTEGEVGT